MYSLSFCLINKNWIPASFCPLFFIGQKWISLCLDQFCLARISLKFVKKFSFVFRCTEPTVHFPFHYTNSALFFCITQNVLCNQESTQSQWQMEKWGRKNYSVPTTSWVPYLLYISHRIPKESKTKQVHFSLSKLFLAVSFVCLIVDAVFRQQSANDVNDAVAEQKIFQKWTFCFLLVDDDWTRNEKRTKVLGQFLLVPLYKFL